MPLGLGGTLVNSNPDGTVSTTQPYGPMSREDVQLFNAREAQARGNAHDASASLPADYAIDPETGQIREKTFWENHGDTIGFLGDAAMAFAGGGAFGNLGGLASTAAETGGKSMSFLDDLKTGLGLFNQASGAVNNAKGFAGPSPASSLATTAGSIESQRAAALAKQAQLQQEQDQLAQNRALLALKAPGMEAGNAVRGDVLANSKDASFTGLPSYIHVPQMSGGLRPSMLSQNSRALGANMSRNALMHNMSGDDVPDLTPLPTRTGYDTALQGVATGAGFLNALGGLGKQSPAAPSGGGSYSGAGTPGYPGDGASPVNPMMPPTDPLLLGAPQAANADPGMNQELLDWMQQHPGQELPNG